VREAKQWMVWRLLTARIYYASFQKIPTVRTTRKILSGFCAEAAVLVAIFPYLDFFIENYRTRGIPQNANGTQPMDMASVKHLSVTICLTCLVAAIVLAIKSPGEEE
jgi:hypothetical protein